MNDDYCRKQGAALGFEKVVTRDERHGVVYTRAWVVDTMLDLAGYKAEENLVDALAIEPAAGVGSFVLPMVRRLIASCRQQQRNITDCIDSLLVYEVDAASSKAMRSSLSQLLAQLNILQNDADLLLDTWLRTGDYLLDATRLPRADFVIGNPPYIRLEAIEESMAILYRMLYPTMIGRADVYIAFFEAALRQIKPSGVCAFICPDRWMLNQYGAGLRKLVTSGYHVETIVEMHQAHAFEAEVNAYPAITIIRRGQQGQVVVASVGSDLANKSPGEIARLIVAARDSNQQQVTVSGIHSTVVRTWYTGNAPWPRISPAHLTILQRLETEFHPLEDGRTRVSIGVATGADDIFITTDPDLVESAQLLPLAMAYDIVDGKLKWSGQYLVNPWNQHGLVVLDRYPRLKMYFERHRERLQQRHINKRNQVGWYRTIDRVHHDLLSKPKLYIADIKDKLNPVLDTGETYPHHNLYFIQSEDWDLEVLGGLLLSAIGQFFIECYGIRMRGGYLRFQAQYLRRIRVPRPKNINYENASQLRAAFQLRDRERATWVALNVYTLSNVPGTNLYE